MSFGLSTDQTRSLMIGGDVVVAWIDKETLKGYTEDYYLEDKAQCSGPKGSCPDNRFQENTNSIRLLNAAMVNGYSIVTYQRPLKASDHYDLPILSNRSQAIIWAIGPLNQRNEVSFHSHYLKQDKLIHFGRPARWNCPMPESEQPAMIPEEVETEPPATTKAPRVNARRRGGNRGTVKQEEKDNEDSATKNREQTQQQRRRGPQRVNQRQQSPPPPAPVKKRDAWEIPPIQCHEPEDGVFYAQMGPTGGKRGYPAITGHVGWGISWYINGLLIPELNVVRGKTYTFVIEGGSNPEVSAKYHPFYITDDPVGGYEYKTDEEKQAVKIFAGVAETKDGLVPTGTGRLCHWTAKGEMEADDFESFGAYQRTLELKCDQGEPGVIQWTPDKNTPDTVYYQCFTHRYLGWKINVHDVCDDEPQASEIQATILAAPDDFHEKIDADLEESPSLRVETRVKPNDINSEVKEDKNNNDISETKISDIRPIIVETPTQEPQTVTDNIAISSIADNETYLPPPQIFYQNPIITRYHPQIPVKMFLMQPPRPKTPYYKKRFPVKSRPYQFESRPVKTHQKIKHVEISPQQASTEREPDISHAINTGFKPSSIKIETGFKPIMLINTNFQDRKDEIEINAESESGVIKKETFEKIKLKPLHLFEPIFVPSPIEPMKEKLHKKKPLRYTKIVIKYPRSINNDTQDELVAEAAERTETYYLPPHGQKPVEVMRYSNIDIEAPPNLDSPPDVVVTYDGKKVSGQSLTAKLSDKPSISDLKLSKASSYIKAGPQFGKFHGELPPLDPDSLFSMVPKGKSAVLNRDLDTPLVGDSNGDSLKLSRVKREAHHTPEHTAEQEREQKKNGKSNGNILIESYFSLIFTVYLLRLM